MDNNTFTIALHKVDEFKGTIAKLNKKLVKMGCEPIVVVKEAEVMKDSNPYVSFEVSVPFSKINGWELVGKLTPDVNLQLVIKAYKKDVSLTSITTASCDHCHQNRKRNSTYVLRGEQGELKQVGSGCLNEFIGLNILKTLEVFDAFIEKTTKDLTEQTEHMTFPGYKVSDIVSGAVLAYFNISKKWEKGYYGSSGTANMVFSLIQNAHNNTPELKTDEEVTAYNALTAHIESPVFKEACFKDTDSNFMANIRTAFFHAGETLTRSTHEGLIAWAVYDMLNKGSFGYGSPVKKVDLSNSKHLGSIGEKLTLTITIKSANTYLAPSFGYRETESFSTLLTGYDEGYNWVSFFLQGSGMAKEGDTMTITGKVKDHAEYKGVKQTKLFYVKVA